MIASRKAGDAWLGMATTAILKVPSVVFDAERNVLINPDHPDFKRIKVASVEPVRWDERLFEEKPARSKS
jgi:RES domain-containing protein